MPLPPSASLSSGGIARRQLDQLVVEERRARLQAVGHRHVVDALDRVVDEHDPRVQPQRAVDGRGGAGALEPLARRTRARRRRPRPRRVSSRSCRVVAVEELRRVGVQPAARRLEQRRVPAVAAEHLVGALAGLHDLALAADRLREQPERDAVVRDHRLAHRRDRARERARRARPSRRGSGGGRSRTPRATRSENANSLPSRPPASGKPIENVASPRWPCSASSATIRLESSPPESSTPTGTSETIRRRTATRSASSSASRHSSGERSAAALVRRVPVLALARACRRARR